MELCGKTSFLKSGSYFVRVPKMILHNDFSKRNAERERDSEDSSCCSKTCKLHLCALSLSILPGLAKQLELLFVLGVVGESINKKNWLYWFMSSAQFSNLKTGHFLFMLLVCFLNFLRELPAGMYAVLMLIEKRSCACPGKEQPSAEHNQVDDAEPARQDLGALFPEAPGAAEVVPVVPVVS